MGITASALLMLSPRLRPLPIGDTTEAMADIEDTEEDMDIGTASALLMLSPRLKPPLSTMDTTAMPAPTMADTITASALLMLSPRLRPLPMGDTTEAMAAMVATE